CGRDGFARTGSSSQPAQCPPRERCSQNRKQSWPQPSHSRAMAVAASTGQPCGVRLWSRSRGDNAKNGNSPRRRDLKRISHPQPGHATAAPGRASGEQNEQNAHSEDRKSTRLNSSHVSISYAVFCLKKKNKC